jgi:hypothetical protein
MKLKEVLIDEFHIEFIDDDGYANIVNETLSCIIKAIEELAPNILDKEISKKEVQKWKTI